MSHFNLVGKQGRGRRASDTHNVLMTTFKWYLFVSSIFSICYCMIFTILPYRISYDFRDWLKETLGLDGIAPNYTFELQGICGLNFFLLLPLSIVLLMRKKWYALLGIFACGLMIFDVYFWAVTVN